MVRGVYGDRIPNHWLENWDSHLTGPDPVQILGSTSLFSRAKCHHHIGKNATAHSFGKSWISNVKNFDQTMVNSACYPGSFCTQAVHPFPNLRFSPSNRLWTYLN